MKLMIFKQVTFKNMCNKKRKKNEKILYKINNILIISISIFIFFELISMFYFDITKHDCSLIIFDLIFEALYDDYSTWFGFLETTTTMVVAIVVLFYTIRDGQKMGVPTRTIMMYTFGSYSIPILLLLSLILVPTINLLKVTGNVNSACLAIFFCYYFQLLTIFEIMVITSSRYSSFILAKVGKKYLRARQLKKPEKETLRIVPHLAGVLFSDESLSIKFSYINMFVYAPFYELEYYFKHMKNTKKSIHTPSNNLKKDLILEYDDEILYQYYYNNLYEVFLNKQDFRSSGYYGKLHEKLINFVRIVTDIYNNQSEEDVQTEAKMRKKCLLILSAILNSMLITAEAGAEKFLENFFVLTMNSRVGLQSDLGSRMFILYLLFLELQEECCGKQLCFVGEKLIPRLNLILDGKGKKTISYDNLKNILFVENNGKGFCDDIISIWKIWCNQFLYLSDADASHALYRALFTITKNYDITDEISMPIWYVLRYI